MLQDLAGYARAKGWRTQVLSAYRSPAYQDELRARWDRGDRAGLAVRPAEQSAHSEGRAIDMTFGSSAWEPADYRQSAVGGFANMGGWRWGGTWTPPDPNHFEVPR